MLINTHTGLVDSSRCAGGEVLAENALQPLVIKDDEDPWGMRERQIRRKLGGFKLMSPKKAHGSPASPRGPGGASHRGRPGP